MINVVYFLVIFMCHMSEQTEIHILFLLLETYGVLKLFFSFKIFHWNTNDFLPLDVARRTLTPCNYISVLKYFSQQTQASKLKTA